MVFVFQEVLQLVKVVVSESLDFAITKISCVILEILVELDVHLVELSKVKPFKRMSQRYVAERLQLDAFNIECIVTLSKGCAQPQFVK